eukprot:8430180-Pyramimonas_sp.AAC.1
MDMWNGIWEGRPVTTPAGPDAYYASLHTGHYPNDTPHSQDEVIPAALLDDADPDILSGLAKLPDKALPVPT